MKGGKTILGYVSRASTVFLGSDTLRIKHNVISFGTVLLITDINLIQHG